MPDMGSAAGALFDVLGPILKPAVGIALRSAVGVVLLSGLVSIGCFVVAYDGVWWRGLLGAALGLACCAVLGGLVVVKRTVLGALAVGMERLSLGKRTLNLLLTGLLAVSDQDALGERGVAVARRAERLPLADAEQRLRQACLRLVREDGGGWLRRKLRTRLLTLVETVTLARFRDEAAAHGGVDLVLVRDQLGHAIDATLYAQLSDLARRVTIGLALLAMGISIIVALLLRAWL